MGIISPAGELSTASTSIVDQAINETVKSVKNVDEKQNYIQRQGAIQHAMISQAVFSNSTNLDEWWTLCEKIADKAIKYMNRGY